MTSHLYYIAGIPAGPLPSASAIFIAAKSEINKCRNKCSGFRSMQYLYNWSYRINNEFLYL